MCRRVLRAWRSRRCSGYACSECATRTSGNSRWMSVAISLLILCGCRESNWITVPDSSGFAPSRLNVTTIVDAADLSDVSSHGMLVWAVGAQGTVLNSEDGGKHWVHRDIIERPSLQAIRPLSDGNSLWALGSGGDLFYSEDRGSNWKAVTLPQRTGEDLFTTADGKHLFVVGGARYCFLTTRGEPGRRAIVRSR
jgi:hypothetical protein